MPSDERRILRVVVVDDEPLGRERILDLLAEATNVRVVGEAADGVAAIEVIRATRPDLVFLDVQMPRLTGLDVVRSIGADEMPAVVFVTAYDDFALAAFDSAAVDYLLKPFRDDRFKEALDRARRRIAADTREQLHEQLLALLRGGSGHAESSPPAPRYLERIAIESRGRTTVLPVSEIEYVTASGSYAELHVGARRHLIRESLNELEQQLDPAMFQRVHRSAIVRFDLIETLLRREGSECHVQLKSGVRIRVGRSRREALERRLGRTP